MKLGDEVEPSRTVVENVDVVLETVRSGKNIPPIFSTTKSLYANIRRGRVPKKYI